MSTLFYAGPISLGMGRRWDDKFEPEGGTESKPQRGRVPSGRTGTPMAPPPAPPIDPRALRIDPVCPLP